MPKIIRGGQWMKLYPDGLVFKPTCAREAQNFDTITAGVLASLTNGESMPDDVKCKCDKCSPPQPNNVVIINGEGHYLSVLSEVGCKFRECVLNAELFSEERAKYVVFLFPRLRAIPTKTPCQCHGCVTARHNKINEALEQQGDTKTTPSWYNDDALADKKGREILREWGIQSVTCGGKSVINVGSLIMTPAGFARRIYRTR